MSISRIVKAILFGAVLIGSTACSHRKPRLAELVTAESDSVQIERANAIVNDPDATAAELSVVAWSLCVRGTPAAGPPSFCRERQFLDRLQESDPDNLFVQLLSCSLADMFFHARPDRGELVSKACAGLTGAHRYHDYSLELKRQIVQIAPSLAYREFLDVPTVKKFPVWTELDQKEVFAEVVSFAVYDSLPGEFNCHQEDMFERYRARGGPSAFPQTLASAILADGSNSYGSLQCARYLLRRIGDAETLSENHDPVSSNQLGALLKCQDKKVTKSIKGIFESAARAGDVAAWPLLRSLIKDGQCPDVGGQD